MGLLFIYIVRRVFFGLISPNMPHKGINQSECVLPVAKDKIHQCHLDLLLMRRSINRVLKKKKAKGRAVN